MVPTPFYPIAMSDQNADGDDGALPFQLETPHPNVGVGVYKSIVALESLMPDEDSVPCDSARQAIHDGLCYYCGYDRGVHESHTEVPGFVVECHNCERTLLKDDGE